MKNEICCVCGYPFDAKVRNLIIPNYNFTHNERRKVNVVCPDNRKDICCSECSLSLSTKYVH